ncbi:MAG: hypothetical protein QOD09_427 [Bradyrhizobium sp.]|nr:hypothetical protein [Bradyrhizobium sp.]
MTGAARLKDALPPPLLLDGLDLAHLRGKILDRRALVFRQRVGRQLGDQHFEDLADPPELTAIGASRMSASTSGRGAAE